MTSRAARAVLLALALSLAPHSLLAHEGHEHEDAVPQEVVVAGLAGGAFVLGAGGAWWWRRRDMGDPEDDQDIA